MIDKDILFNLEKLMPFGLKFNLLSSLEWQVLQEKKLHQWEIWY